MPFAMTPTTIPAPHPRHAEIAIVEEMERLLATPEKWCKGSYQAFNGEARSFCVLGSLNRVVTGEPYKEIWYGSHFAGRKVKMALDSALPGGAGILHEFNDAPSTTHADVLNLLSRVKQSFLMETVES